MSLSPDRPSSQERIVPFHTCLLVVRFLFSSSPYPSYVHWYTFDVVAWRGFPCWQLDATFDLATFSASFEKEEREDSEGREEREGDEDEDEVEEREGADEDADEDEDEDEVGRWKKDWHMCFSSERQDVDMKGQVPCSETGVTFVELQVGRDFGSTFNPSDMIVCFVCFVCRSLCGGGRGG